VRIEKLAQAYDIDIKYVHFPLHPETPAEGRALQDLFGTGPDDIAAKNARMSGLMAAEGLPYGARSHTYNSRLAQELGTWADTQPGGSAFHDAVYKAYFVDKKNVGDVDVLVEIAGSVDLDETEARAVLTERRYKDAVDADWARSRQYGVTGVPTFVADRMGVVGAQPYEMLAQLVEKAGAKRRG
jgi:predicted DsbA family dithiol-disulfide isomerase